MSTVPVLPIPGAGGGMSLPTDYGGWKLVEVRESSRVDGAYEYFDIADLESATNGTGKTFFILVIDGAKNNVGRKELVLHPALVHSGHVYPNMGKFAGKVYSSSSGTAFDYMGDTQMNVVGTELRSWSNSTTGFTSGGGVMLVFEAG